MFNYLGESQFNWLDGHTIKPYVFVREENRVQNPGSLFDSSWFPFKPLYINPLNMKEVGFADQILKLESLSFASSGMAMDRWVFYDCAVMPGFVAGFAQHRDSLPKTFSQVLTVSEELEWIPLSLFIVIPTMSHKEEEWVAHNLCSVNNLVEAKDKLYGLGFLTKAFALWYANIGNCCGMTQWGSPATRLHSQYGEFEVLTAYTPVHSYAKTLTYRLRVDPQYWDAFFSKDHSKINFLNFYSKTDKTVDPESEDSLIRLQLEIESSKVRYFLNPEQMRARVRQGPLNLYVKK